MKKILSFMLIVMILVCNSEAVFAAEMDDPNIVYEELSTTPPSIKGGISVYSTERPSKDNVYPNNTQNYVYGTTNGVPLYTNSCFHGVTKITGSIVNDYRTDLKITLRYYWGALDMGTLSSQKVSAGDKGTFSFEGLDPNTYYFLEFDGKGMDFHGFVGGITG